MPDPFAHLAGKRKHLGAILKQLLGLGQVLIVDPAHVRSVEVVSYPPQHIHSYVKPSGCPEKCYINSGHYYYCYIKPGQKLAEKRAVEAGVSVQRVQAWTTWPPVDLHASLRHVASSTYTSRWAPQPIFDQVLTKNVNVCMAAVAWFAYAARGCCTSASSWYTGVKVLFKQTTHDNTWRTPVVYMNAAVWARSVPLGVTLSQSGCAVDFCFVSF